MQRDSIDFGKMNIPSLFVKMFIPTLMGFLFTAMFNLADGIFVGQGVGSDALAAVNIAAPIFLLATATALMFGTGVSVVAAIHLARGSKKAACINMTQAFGVSLLITTLLMLLAIIFPRQVCMLFGGSERLMPLVTDYLVWVSPCLVMVMIEIVGMFVIRLDGAPKFAMWANIIGSVLNIFLDWLFVFPLNMGIKGAAIASSISAAVGAALVIIYLSRYSRNLHFYRLKTSRKSMRLTLRNVGYMSKLGLSTFIGEAAISCLMTTGNFMFMKYLHEDGVAAFSVACYLFPLVFMFGNAISQTSLPIVSYNHGLGDRARILKTLRLSLVLAIICGLLLTLGGIFLRSPIISLFLEPDSNAFTIADEGFPYLAASFLFFTLNLVLIGFFQSIERPKPAITFMLLRGFIVLVPCFIVLPRLLGTPGLWLTITTAELITCLTIAAFMLHNNIKIKQTSELNSQVIK